MKIDLDRPWVEWPIVGVTLNPIKGEHDTYVSFCDLTMARMEHGGAISYFDTRVKVRSFRDYETIRFKTIGWDYHARSRKIEDVLEEVSSFARGAVPAAVNPKLCSGLLHRSVRMARAGGWSCDMTGLFVLREKSRWIDLGEWRRCAEKGGHEVAPFSGLAVSGIDRVTEALRSLHKLAKLVGIKDDWTIRQVLDYDPIPF